MKSIAYLLMLTLPVYGCASSSNKCQNSHGAMPAELNQLPPSLQPMLDKLILISGEES